MMYIYATETFEVDRVIDRFANAKKRRLLLLLSRSVGMKLKFDRNIIAILELLVFKELPPFESSGYFPDNSWEWAVPKHLECQQDLSFVRVDLITFLTKKSRIILSK